MGKRKSERKKRKKRLIKQISGLELQKIEHEFKLETEKGRKDTTPRYWMEEIESFEKRKQEREEKLKKLKKNILNK